MSDFFGNVDIAPVVLVDRMHLCRERFKPMQNEIMFAGRVWPLPKDNPDFMLPRVIVEWLFDADRHRYHTTEGYLPRFGIRTAPADLRAVVGDEAFSIEPLEPIAVIEGWNVEAHGLDREARERDARVTSLPLVREHLEGGKSAAYADRR